MLLTDDLLHSYLRLLLSLSGAEAVSLYLRPAPDAPEGFLLLHSGPLPAVPELADLAAAEELPDGAGTAPASSSGPQVTASREAGGTLIRWSADLWLTEPGPDGGEPRRRKSDRRGTPANSPTLWIGLRFPRRGTMGDSPTETAADVGSAGVAEDVESDSGWRRALELGGVLAGHCQRVDAVLRDPLTELPGRADFQTTLHREVAAAGTKGQPLALLFTSADDFNVINRRFGSDAGDSVVREIAGRLKGALRQSDLIHRYGGVIFAVILPDTVRDDAVAVADKLHGALTSGGYLDGAVRLGVSFGIATRQADDPGEKPDDVANELIRQADRALNKATISTSGHLAVWRQGSTDEVVAPRDRLAGIFTADLAKDYRNMLLLWDTVEIMTTATDPAELAAKTVERLAATFKPDRAGLFRWPPDDPQRGPELAAGYGGRGDGTHRAGLLVLSDAERGLLERARRKRELVEERLTSADDSGMEAAYAMPLVARDEVLGCLYLAGRAETLRPDTSDLIFLKALAGQLAAALDRAEMAQRERHQKEQESRRLRSELEELRQVASETELVFCSQRMEALLKTVHRVASTDATVLVTGASGTGKELVARMIHTASPRRGKPPLVVDCTVLSASLIDSELFGHERGAYTGALGRTVGRLAEAAGSTLILDEIGELPLAVQAKLLRFVQEKQVTPVGGTRTRSLDVRLVAVTNRNLAEEVTAGRFRQDLYYRLKVIHLEVPALAERPEDVPLLTEHFVRRFSQRYGKQVRGLTPAAAALAARHSWPGNVRELENRILQAVILCEGEEIGPQDLDLTTVEPLAGGAATMDLDLGALEARHIERVLESEEGSVARAARRLGIQRSTLYQKIKKYGLERP